MQGRVPFAVVLCKFNDIGVAPLPPSYYLDAISNDLASYWRDISFSAVDLGESEVFGWYTMVDYSFFKNSTLSRGAWISEAKKLAASAGEDLSKFYGVIAVVNGGQGHYLNTPYGVDEGNAGLDVAAQVPGVWGENHWRYCSKCQALNFVDTPGPCPAGENHDDTGSWDYSLALNQPGFAGESGWGHCSNCQALNYEGPDGHCSGAGGGPHVNSPGASYTLSYKPVTFPGQDLWQWCNKCQVLAWTGRTPGPCAAGGTHSHIGSLDYALVNNLGANGLNLTFLGHETGHSLGLGHSWLASPETVYGNRWDVMSGNQYSFSDPDYPPAGPGIDAANLDFLGWLPDVVTWTPASVEGGSETIQLLALSNPALGFLAAKVTRNDSIYYVEHRQPAAWDQGIPGKAVLINEVRTWLWCLKCQELTLAAASPAGPCAGTGAHDHTGSAYYTLLHETLKDPSNHDYPGQADWNWCSKCQALAYSAGPPGACPGGATHDFGGSNNYTLVHDVVPPPAGGQPAWRYCRKCQALNYGGFAQPGPCQAGGLHDNTGSYNYGVYYSPGQRHSFLIGDASGNVQWLPGKVFLDKPRSLAVVVHSFDSAEPVANVSIANSQSHWGWCSKCQGLAYTGIAPGVCPAGGPHDFAGSNDYSLLHDLPGTIAQSNWRWCSKCQGLSYAGDSPGVCPADHQPHATASWDYALLHDTAMADAQADWRWCSKCQGLAFAGNSPGVCPAGGGHNTSASYDYNLIDV
jgi:hypothetical protein